MYPLSDNSPEKEKVPQELWVRSQQMNEAVDAISAELGATIAAMTPNAPIPEDHVASVMALARQATMEQGEGNVPKAA